MKILLVNPNRFCKPPVVPIGLEYVASAVESMSTHALRVCDLCFADDPTKALLAELSADRYEIVGITVRNIDSVIAKGNQFFLDDIASFTNMVKRMGAVVVAGGAACDADPYAMKDYLNVDYVIRGPGEIAFVELANAIAEKRSMGCIINGWSYGIGETISRNPLKYFNYASYIAHGGIAAFQTSAGCPSRCHFCYERCTPLFFRNYDAVIDDLLTIIRAGYDHFHLADSEFNVSLEHACEFLKKLSLRLKQGGLTMRWALYMKPTPFSGELFDLLKETGAYLVTLSFESSLKEQARCGYSYRDVEIFLRECTARSIDVAVDMLSGAPGETIDEMKIAIEFFSHHRPSRVNINTAFRVYRNTPLFAHLCENFADEQRYVSDPKALKEKPLSPVFYQKFSDDDVRKIAGSDPLFAIEGEEKGVNYQRVKTKNSC
ncbi:MAG: cobalamin-dependent protein [Spirochaetes bacterium]|nr:cobalamin-dependent protein [Spirochaetota bacterium]